MAEASWLPMLTRRAGPTTPESPEGGIAPDTSPTWELELLISGAVLFALFQLPGALEAAYDTIEPHLTRGPRMMAFLAYWYAKAAVVTLIACFVLHLAARAYWVGLVGLHSVFPNGPQWEKTKFGPVTRELYRERLPALPTLISRTDNLCSVIFSFAFLIVLLFAMSILVVGIVIGIAYLVSELAFDGRHFLVIYNGLLFAIFVGPVILRSVDQRRGSAIVPGSPAHRRLRRAGAVYYRVQLFGLYGTILTTLFSNVKGKVIYPIFFAFLLLAFMGSVAHTFVHDGLLTFNSYRYFSDEGGHGLRSSHYESQWNAGTGFVGVPSIPSDVVTGPYLRLFIPLSAQRHNEVIPKQCPQVPALDDRGIHLGAGTSPPDRSVSLVLECLTRLHRPSVNGRELASTDFHFHTHPRSGARGIMAYIPTAGLPTGRSTIVVHRLRNPRARSSTPSRPPHVIAFWR